MASNKRPIPKEDAENIAGLVGTVLVLNGVTTQVCGSLRRGKPIVQDVDMVVSVDTKRIYKILFNKVDLKATLTKKEDKYTNFVINGVQFDFLYSREESWGAATLFFTGSGLFNILLRGIAKKQEYKLNEKGLWFKEDLIAGRFERQIFDALGYEYLEPKDREVTTENKRRKWLKEKNT